MACNQYRPHLIVIPEDQANRDMINGFWLELDARKRHQMQIESPAKGRDDAIAEIERNALPKYADRRILVVVDFDNHAESRIKSFKNAIPNEYENRVFILGVLTKPENLRSELKLNLEEIGHKLAKECQSEERSIWQHPLLKHNQDTIIQLRKAISFLF